MKQMQRYFAEVSYHGGAYHGWQRQPNALSVQEVLETEMSKFLPMQEGIVASGRTDTGVHCLQQFFHFDLPSALDTSEFLFKVNKMLPHDIAIRSLRRVGPEAHARFDAVQRSYLYRISPRKDVFKHGLVWQYGVDLNLDKMNEAARMLQTFEDFQSLSKVNTDVNHFLCNIHRADWFRTDDEIRFEISANRFLRGMVRTIVGTCVDIGRGRTNVDEFQHILESRNRQLAGPAAPPEGLYLSEVIYPEETFTS